MSRPLQEKGWLRPGDGERWEMDGELKIGAMGFEEGYVSLVEMEKSRWVKVRALSRRSFALDPPRTGALLLPADGPHSLAPDL